MNKNIPGSTGILMAVLGWLWGSQYGGNFGSFTMAVIGLVIGLLFEIASNTAKKA